VGTETMTAIGNILRLTIPDVNNTEIRSTYNYELPIGDFDVQVDIAGYTVDGDADIDIHLWLNDNHFNNYVDLHMVHDKSDQEDFRFFQRVDGGGRIHVVSNYSVADCPTAKLRFKRIGTVFYAYYTISTANNNWIYLGSYNHSEAASISRVSLSLNEYGSGGTVDFDNLKFNKAECPSGDQWSTTTTSTSTLTSTTTTEPPV